MRRVMQMAVLCVFSDKHSGKVKTFMLDMMTPLICEADSVSQELLDVILVNLVDPKKVQRVSL